MRTEEALQTFMQTKEFAANKNVCETMLQRYLQHPKEFLLHTLNKEKSDAWFHQKSER